MTAAATSLLERFGRLAVESRSAALLWLGQSSFALRIVGRTVLLDPFPELAASAETTVIVPRRLRPFVYTVCLDSAAQ